MHGVGASPLRRPAERLGNEGLQRWVFARLGVALDADPQVRERLRFELTGLSRIFDDRSRWFPHRHGPEVVEPVAFLRLHDRLRRLAQGLRATAPARRHAAVAGLLDDARRDRLADGFVTAIAAVGALLAEHFPPRPDDVNELDDHLVEI